MEGLTLAVAIVASVLTFLLSPIQGLVLYLATLAWYPPYLSVPVGTVDFTVRRIVILVLLARLLLVTDLPGRFKFIWLDKLVVIYFIAQTLSGSMNTNSIGEFIENRGGAAFDMMLPYFAVRMIVQSKQQYLTLLKAILIIGAPLASIGFYQCLTGKNPVGFLKAYGAWGAMSTVSLSRLGFFRAEVTFPMPIMYGLFFAMLGPLCVGMLQNCKRYRIICLIGLVLMGVGIFSSMSSGPMLAALLSVGFIALYRWRRHWKVGLISFILACVCVEIISNRHFYNVLGDLTLAPITAWYRGRLVEVALFEGGMADHWLLGYGYNVDPGWHQHIDGRNHTDIVNHYLLILSSFGLVGLLPFLAMNVAAVKRLIRTYKACFLASDRWLVWCLAGSVFGLLGGLMTVGLFGQPTTIYYMIIGFVGVMPDVVARSNSAARVITQRVTCAERFTRSDEGIPAHSLKE